MNNHNQNQEEQNGIYQYLPEAKPLQNKKPKEAVALFPFIGDPGPIEISMAEIQQEMEVIPEGRNNSVHEIGEDLSELFKNRIYQSYDELYLLEENAKFATCSFNSQEKELFNASKIAVNDETCLIFQSRFESGNLAVASKSQANSQYYLALQRDTNSQATCQWYYFSVENKNNVGEFTFNIVNLIKSYSAYENGMRPCVFSEQSGKWHRGGYNISYRKNSIPYRNGKNYFTLQFTYNFTAPHSKYYFAYNYPYTFTKLQNYLLQKQKNYPSIFNVRNFALTPAGNPLSMVSITNPSSENQNRKKMLIMICARVHPGQSNSSYACEGLMNFLLGKDEEADNLRKQYIIKIIPFLNPDGVIHGNYRTSLSGVDLNRRWNKPEKDLHSEIYNVKKYLNETEYRKHVFIDLHGHSKKRSAFMYGCLNKDAPYLSKLFPFIMSKKCNNFCYYNCNFSTPSSREGTSRINVWKQYKIDYSYTFELSFCGPNRSRSHFGISNYLQIGMSLGKVLSLYFCSKNSKISNDLELQELMSEFYQDKIQLEGGEQMSEGSESGEQQKQIIVEKQKIPSKPHPKMKTILSKFLNQSSAKWTSKEPKTNAKNKSSEEINYLKRKNLTPSRISIQKIDLGNQMSETYASFGNYKCSLKVINKDPQIKKRENSGLVNKNSYRPYSYSKSHHSNRQSEDLLILPKVVRYEEIKYRKYRKNEIALDFTLSREQAPKSIGKFPTSFSREISLIQKIEWMNSGSLQSERERMKPRRRF